MKLLMSGLVLKKVTSNQPTQKFSSHMAQVAEGKGTDRESEALLTPGEDQV